MKTICIDFDGVLHSYVSGWQGPDVINDPPVEGAIDWLNGMIDDPEWRPVIYSARSESYKGIRAMEKWLAEHGCKTWQLDFPIHKPKAFLTLDDRAICFDGTFPDKKTMNGFKTWDKRPEQKYPSQSNICAI
jgi:hypothetical protein